MTIFLDRGPFITIPDAVNPGMYKTIRNPEWQGELPEIVSFTDFLKWNYTADYGRFIRALHNCDMLTLPYGIPFTTDIADVAIIDGKYDRIDRESFSMYVFCNVTFTFKEYRYTHKYIVRGVYNSGSKSNFFQEAEPYNGEKLRLFQPLDEYLVPKLSKDEYQHIADEIINKFYLYKANYPCQINAYAIAEEMGLQIKTARLSINGNIQSKLLPYKCDTLIYDRNSIPHKVDIDLPTILVDNAIGDNWKIQNAIIHECVHYYLHNLFYELQSYYRRIIGRSMPEFDDYFLSKHQKKSLHWMETQANSITRHIQMPEDVTAEAVIDFLENIAGEPTWDDYRKLINYVKDSFCVARNAAKKRIIELGWNEVRGVYVYNVIDYVDDYDVEYDFPDNYTYTLSLRQITDIYDKSEDFVALVRSGKFIYVDGHVVINSDKYVLKEDGMLPELTEYARHHMNECCIDFKIVYTEFDYYYTYGELHKEELSKITAENREFNADQESRLKQALNEINNEEKKLKQSKEPVNEFGRAVQFHMARCNVTEDIVADRSGLGVDTVSKMRQGETVKLETVLAFCVALELEEAFRYDLMKKADVRFDMRKKAHKVYLTIFDILPDANVFQINQFLKNENLTPWTRECECKKRRAKKNAAV